MSPLLSRLLHEKVKHKIVYWISVKERMPSGDMRALVTDGKEFIFIADYHHDTNWWGLSSDDALNLETVTHWMHLPNLP